MTLEAVIGRIDQILQMQQQLLDPAAAGSTSASDGGAALSGNSSSSAATTFATALANAQASSALGATGLTGTSTDPLAGVDGSTTDPLAGGTTAADPLAGLLGSTGVSSTDPLAGLLGTGGASTYASGVPPQVQAMVSEANSLIGKPYVYGGGHGGWGPQSGYDCSGFVSAVLHAGGYLSEPVDTTALPSQPGIVSGPGQYVTIYDRSLPGQEGHVIIDIGGQFYESGGMAGAWGGGGGVEKIGTPSASYLATFNAVLHPEGL
jgi:cell wall-associated NlpC family hydrolase